MEKSLKGVGRVKNITISKLASRVSSFEFQEGNSLVPRLIFFFREKEPGYEAKRGGLFYHVNDMKIYRPQSCYNCTK